MNDRSVSLRLLRGLALVSGSLVLAFLLWMLVGHLVGNANGPHGMRFSSASERAAFLFFPVGTIVGLALAYKWELPGGVLVLISLTGLFALRPDLLPTAFWLWGLPAVFYLGHWWLGRRMAPHA